VKAPRKNVGPSRGRLLVFNCHEPWVYQLAGMPYELDVVVGLTGRDVPGWDARMRPLPGHARTIELEDAPAYGRQYTAVIAHNITDLLDARELDAPKILVLHATVEGRLESEGSRVPPRELRASLQRLLELTGTHPVAVSSLKGRSWELERDIVPCGVDPGAYLDYSGELAMGLRVCNHIDRRRSVLAADFADAAFGELPVRLIGHNPTRPGVHPARDWDDLKEMLRAHRFCVHTADPRFEDGYNMASLEAMAAGMPVLGNRHPTSPIEHGVSGFLSDDPRELRRFAELLLADRTLAIRMGQAARRTVIERFHVNRFRTRFKRSIELARAQWLERARV
jgi:hypothetical protein